MKRLVWPGGSQWTLGGELHINAGCPRGAAFIERKNRMAKKLKKGKKIAAKKSLKIYIKY